MSATKTIPYRPRRMTHDAMVETIEADHVTAQQRRTVRSFSTEPVPRVVIERAIQIAGTAPSGAHRQPWYFVVIEDAVLKAKLRDAAEAEERSFYEHRITPAWREALAPLGTDFQKEHLTSAPFLIVVFRRDYEVLPDGSQAKSYYAQESVGIAVGFLIQALHRAGLATLTHTPAPMSFLRELCGRPASEKPFVILPVGYPSLDCEVPDLSRKPLEAIATFLSGE
jgi:nitroreductase